MIQRIQSVYLLLAIAIGISMFFLPFASITSGASVGSFKVLHLLDISVYENDIIKTSTGIYLPAILTTVFITIALVIVFSYKNRKMQIMMCKLNMLLLALLIALIFYQVDMLSYGSDAITKPIYHAGTYLPVIALILLYMSLKAIIKDDALIKSADRLR
jgi:peptidoglycan/LPS O-acetylase OafA/YrhL